MKENIIDMYNFNLGLIVKNLKFNDLFLRDQCKINPILSLLRYDSFDVNNI